MSIAQALPIIRWRHRKVPGRTPAWYLAVTNRCRRALNAERQAAEAAAYEGPKVWIAEAEVPFHCFVGTRLIGANNGYRGITNGTFLTVEAMSDTHVTLNNDLEQFDVTFDALARHTRLGWALTIFSAQGRSLRGGVELHEVSHPRFSEVHAYVALSRAAPTSGLLSRVRTQASTKFVW